MRGTWVGVMAAVAGLAGLASEVQACGRCHVPACSGVPVCVQPAFQCVTEMVPYTVMQTRMRVDWQKQECTVMVPVPHTTWIEQPYSYCVPKYETRPVSRRYTVCRLVPETVMVDQCVTVCEAVQTTQTVTETCWQPSTRTVAVPVRTASHCGLGLLCGKNQGAPCGGCQYVTETCYTPVCVTREVPVTQYVPRTMVRQVPVTTCRWVTEERVDQYNIVVCVGMETRNETRRVPCTQVTLEPRTLTKMIPICTPECVPVTLYRPVTRWVPCAPVCPPTAPVAPSMQQQAPSGQGATPTNQA